MLELEKFIDTFEDYLTEKKWNERFDISMEAYLELSEDPNLRTFLGLKNQANDQNRNSAYSKKN